MRLLCFLLQVCLLLVFAQASVFSSVIACPCDQIKMPAQAPPELSIPEGLAYTHTAAYRLDFDKAVDSAKRFCVKYKKEHPDARNLAVVSDVDETILDNREEFKTHPQKFLWSEFEAWIKQARAPLLPKTAPFLKWARKEGFAIIILTGRPEADRIWTIENLVRNGVAYDGLYLRTDDDKSPPQDYKSAVRKSIEDMGFTIVVNIGDQTSDLMGGHSLDCEKLPNEMYFLH